LFFKKNKGGLACSKDAMKYSQDKLKVCVFDFVRPSPHGKKKQTNMN